MSNITYTKASGAELDRIIEAMEKVLVGEKESHIAMACLALAILIQCPTIETKQLAEGVKGASEWIALFASSVEEPLAPGMAN